MKILWLSHLVPYPPKGGVLQRSFHLVRELSKYHEVYLLAFIQKDLISPMFKSVEQGLAEATSELSSFCKEVQFIDIPCDQFANGKKALALKSLFTRLPYTVNWLESKQMVSAISNSKQNVHFDLVHADTISLAPYVKFFTDIPATLDHHNIESHMMLRRAKLESNLLKKLYFFQEGLKLRSYERKVCPKFALNITCSDLDTKRLIEFANNVNVAEIPNGVDIDYFKPNPRIEQIKGRFVFAGRLNAYSNEKAVCFIVEHIWPAVKAKYPHASIDILGANPPLLVTSIANSDPTIRVHGFVDDVRPFLDQAQIYLCPITDGGGTKLKILDALAMQKATIANPIACEGIAVVENKNVMFASTVTDYIAAIDHLLRNDQVRISLGQAARELIEQKYSYKSIGKKLADCFNQLS